MMVEMSHDGLVEGVTVVLMVVDLMMVDGRIVTVTPRAGKTRRLSGVRMFVAARVIAAVWWNTSAVVDRFNSLHYLL